MNFRLGGEFVDKHASSRSCLYCGKFFYDNEALDTHRRIHEVDETLTSLNFPIRSCTSIEINGKSAGSLSNVHQSSTVACSPTPLRSNAANEASRSRSAEHSPGVSQNRIFLSPGGVPSHHSRQTPVASTVASGDTLKRTQGYNLCRPMFSSMGAVFRPESGLSMDGSKRPYVAEISGIADVKNEPKKARIHSDAQVEPDILQAQELPLLNNFVESISGPADDVLSGIADGTNEHKKARVPPDAHVEADIPQLQELPLLNNYVGSVSGQADVDLSLRLASETFPSNELPLLDNFVEYIPASETYDGPEDVDLSLHL